MVCTGSEWILFTPIITTALIFIAMFCQKYIDFSSKCKVLSLPGHQGLPAGLCSALRFLVVCSENDICSQPEWSRQPYEALSGVLTMLMLKTHERAPPHEQAETSHLHTSDRQREFCESDSDTHTRERGQRI